MSNVFDDSLPEWTDEELAVLRSVEDDQPPARSLAAALAAVGVGGALASGAAAAKGASIAASSGSLATTAKWTTLIAISKWVGVAALGGAVVTGGVVALRRKETPAPAKGAVVAPDPPANAVAARAPAPDAVQVPSIAREAEEPVPVSASARAAVRSQPDISREIATLDEARTALRGGRAAEALSALDWYDARFAKAGSLRVEATALRIEALLRSGKRERATTLANGFLARNPKSPYAARVRALIGDNSSGQ